MEARWSRTRTAPGGRRLAAVDGYATFSDDAEARVATLAFANGASQAYSYDPARGWLDQVTLMHPSSTAVQVYEYEHANDGLLSRKTSYLDGQARVASYTYDGRHQLVAVNGTRTAAYERDELDNLTFQSGLGAYVYGAVTSGASPRTLPHAPATESPYSIQYDDGGRTADIRDAATGLEPRFHLGWRRPAHHGDDRDRERELRAGRSAFHGTRWSTAPRLRSVVRAGAAGPRSCLLGISWTS